MAPLVADRGGRCCADSRSRPARAPARPNSSYAATIPTVCRARRSDGRSPTGSVTSSHWLVRARSTRTPQVRRSWCHRPQIAGRRSSAVQPRAGGGNSCWRFDPTLAAISRGRGSATWLVKIRSTPLAARGLAQLAVPRGDHAGAADLYARAVAQAPSSLPLLVEATDQLLNADRSAACHAMTGAAPDRISAHGRVVLQRIRALLAVGRVDDARALLESGIEVPDLREGDLKRSGRPRTATGHCPTATTSGCIPTSSNELGMLARAGCFR